MRPRVRACGARCGPHLVVLLEVPGRFCKGCPRLFSFEERLFGTLLFMRLLHTTARASTVREPSVELSIGLANGSGSLRSRWFLAPTSAPQSSRQDFPPAPGRSR